MNAARCEQSLPRAPGAARAVACAVAVVLSTCGPPAAWAFAPSERLGDSRAAHPFLNKASDSGVDIVRMPPRPKLPQPPSETSVAPPPAVVPPPAPPRPLPPQGRLVKLAVRVGSQPREPDKGWLGVQLDALEVPLALSLGLTNANGVLLLEPVAGGPAAQAGVRFGDILVALNGRPVTQVGETRQRLAALVPGTDAEVELWRSADGGDFLQTLRRLGEGGNAHVMYRLGRFYASGTVVARDDAEAVRWYRMGASAGNLDATTALAVALIEGRGTHKDEQEGLRLLRAAAEKDNHEALDQLGVMLAQGR